VQAVDDLKAHYPLRLLLQIADLPRSTFCDHRRRLSRDDTRAGIKEAIRDAFTAAKSAYGHRRILAILHRQGWQVSKKTVLKLMRQLDLHCPVRRRKRYNSFRGEVGEAADNVLNRQFATESRHTKWVTDVTEFTVDGTKVYLSPVLDLHDNRVISATAGPSPSVKMVTDGLKTAIDTLDSGETPLVHSDQGFQGGFNRSSPHPLAGRASRRGADPIDVTQGNVPGQRRHGRVLQPPQGGMVPHPEPQNPRRVPHGPQRLSRMVEHHPNPAATRIPQPRRIPRQRNRHRLEFYYQIQLSGTTPLLRQYFPKGTDLSRWTAEDLAAVAHALNTRARKRLGWRTPAEALTEHLHGLQTSGVATTT